MLWIKILLIAVNSVIRLSQCCIDMFSTLTVFLQFQCLYIYKYIINIALKYVVNSILTTYYYVLNNYFK